jgi:hypothetical protein
MPGIFIYIAVTIFTIKIWAEHAYKLANERHCTLIKVWRT